MEGILTKINEAYKKGISNPRFQKAINDIVKNPEKDGIDQIKKEDRSIEELGEK